MTINALVTNTAVSPANSNQTKLNQANTALSEASLSVTTRVVPQADSVTLSAQAKALQAAEQTALLGNGGGIEPPRTQGNGGGIEPPATVAGNGGGIEPPATIAGNGGGIEPPL